MRTRISKSSSPDYFFIVLTVALVIFGLVMLTSASSDLAKRDFGDSFYYLKHQILNGLLFGIFGFFICSLVFYRRLTKIAFLLLIINIIALLLVFTPLGFQTKGATRWLNIYGFSFQPGEFLKLTFLIFLAYWMSKNQERSKSLNRGFLPFLLLLSVVTFLLLMQPSTTAAFLIIGASVIMYFLGGARPRFFIGITLLAFLTLVALVFITPYRFDRLKVFLGIEKNELKEAYHINQTLIAIGSGGWNGVGFGQSTAKLKYLPEPLADSIFAIIAEELGFIGAVSLVLIFFLFVWRGLMIARASPDNFGKLLVVGFTSLIGLQAFINIAAVSGLIPLTGVPLPFISYGGTALAVFLTMSGIIVNISKHRR